MRMKAGLISGTVSSAVAVVVAVVSTPIYLRLVGSEAYGVIGFFLTLQAALMVLDGGVGLSVTRAVAQRLPGASQQATADLVAGLARVAWLAAAAILAVFVLASDPLAEGWLKPRTLGQDYVGQCLMLAGVAIAARWPLTLYQGVLMGGDRLVSLNLANTVLTIVSAAGGVAVLAWVRADVRLLFCWLAATALLHVLYCRQMVVRLLGTGRLPARGEVGRFYRQSAAAGALGLVGLLLMQVDKVVLSKLLALDVFGYYVMASMMAGALYALVTPVFHALYPRLSALALKADRTEMAQLYRGSSQALAVLLFPVAAVLGFFSHSVVMLWTGDPVAAQACAPIVTLLAGGTALHGIMFVPYALKLACGASRLALAISSTMLVLALPVTAAAAITLGATGAAAAWLGLNAMYLVFGSAVTHRRLMPGLGLRWLLQDVMPPGLLSLAVAWAGSVWVLAQAWSPAQASAAGALIILACWGLLVGLSERGRQVVRSLWGAPGGVT